MSTCRADELQGSGRQSRPEPGTPKKHRKDIEMSAFSPALSAPAVRVDRILKSLSKAIPPRRQRTRHSAVAHLPDYLLRDIGVTDTARRTIAANSRHEQSRRLAQARGTPFFNWPA
jgi:hypothetical protein